jgi:hypothetical protein
VAGHYQVNVKVIIDLCGVIVKHHVIFNDPNTRPDEVDPS